MQLKHFALIAIAATCIGGEVHAGTLIRRKETPFGKEQIAVARRFGLTLGQPFSTAKRILYRAGWKIDWNTLSEDYPGSGSPHELERKGLLCGEGYDAICTSYFVRGNTALTLTVNPRVSSFPVEEVLVCKGNGCP